MKRLLESQIYPYLSLDRSTGLDLTLMRLSAACSLNHDEITFSPAFSASTNLI